MQGTGGVFQDPSLHPLHQAGQEEHLLAAQQQSHHPQQQPQRHQPPQYKIFNINSCHHINQDHNTDTTYNRNHSNDFINTTPASSSTTIISAFVTTFNINIRCTAELPTTNNHDSNTTTIAIRAPQQLTVTIVHPPQQQTVTIQHIHHNSKQKPQHIHHNS